MKSNATLKKERKAAQDRLYFEAREAEQARLKSLTFVERVAEADASESVKQLLLELAEKMEIV